MSRITEDIENITVGTSYNEEYQITNVIYEQFIEQYQDKSPVHIDSGFAQKMGFREKVMHGNIICGFLSHFIGMVFPGPDGFLVSQEISFANPSYLHDRLRLEAKVKSFSGSTQTLLIQFIFFNQSQNLVAAKGKVRVRIRGK